MAALKIDGDKFIGILIGIGQLNDSFYINSKHNLKINFIYYNLEYNLLIIIKQNRKKMNYI